LIRKLLLPAVAALLITAGLATPALAITNPANACRFQRLNHQTWTHTEVRYTVRCLAKRMNVDVDHALYIANRESSFYWKAWNRSSDCRGIYQHKYAYWSSRVQSSDRKLDKYAVHNRSWFSPRAQAVVTFAMVKKGGWGPWGG